MPGATIESLPTVAEFALKSSLGFCPKLPEKACVQAAFLSSVSAQSSANFRLMVEVAPLFDAHTYLHVHADLLNSQWKVHTDRQTWESLNAALYNGSRVSLAP